MGDIHMCAKECRDCRTFPGCLGFIKWLGVRILNVNSCSILALQTRSSAKFGQVNPDGSKLLWPKPCWENKRGYLRIIRLCFLFLFLLCLCFVLTWISVILNTSHLKIISSDRYPFAVVASLLSLMSPPQSQMKASESVSPVGETEYEWGFSMSAFLLHRWRQ